MFMFNMQIQTNPISINTQKLNAPQKYQKTFAEPLKHDSVEISAKPNKEIPKKTKWGIFLGIGAIGTAVLLILRGKFSKAVELAEHIEFKNATTFKEAIKFGKKHLGIKEYKNFIEQDLDIINWINKGLTQISNKFKGKTKIPKTIEYIEAQIRTKAQVRRDDEFRYKSWLGINKNFITNIDRTLALFSLQNFDDFKFFDTKTITNFQKLLKKYKKDGLTNLEYKLKLLNELEIFQNEKSQSPAKLIQKIIKNPEAKQKLIDKGLLYGENHNKYKLFDQFEIDLDKDLYTQTDPKFVEIIKRIFIKESGYKMKHREQSPYRTIFHEMGHLNNRVRSKNESLTGITTFDQKLNAWGGNKKNFGTAGSVSEYASTSPGEFIAEVFAELVSGNKLSDEVLELYKQLDGIIPA